MQNFNIKNQNYVRNWKSSLGNTVVTSQHAWTPAMGVPIEDSAINTTPTILEEIVEYDDEESSPDEDANPMENNQLKRKNMTSEAMSKKMAKGKQKSEIATTKRSGQLVRGPLNLTTDLEFEM
ncbi:hypothetical protein K1719_009986 [Acacia pycnantha]|nr:hypothetical protein K1719_009986 [Acacia pycnantha]